MRAAAATVFNQFIVHPSLGGVSDGDSWQKMMAPEA
jgi:hypothetical protein